MTDPKETIHIRLDEDTTAIVEIQIRTEPAIPAAMERDRITAPTARELHRIGEKITLGLFTFP